MSDAEWLVGHIENTYDKKGVESLEVYRHAINLVTERGQQLEEVEKVKDLKFLSKYKSGVQNIEEIMKVPPPYKVPDMHVTPPAITKAVTDIVGYSKFCTPKLVYDIRSSEELSLQSPLAVVFRERTSILVADYGENKVLQLTEKGQRINSYTLTDAESNVKSVSYFDAFIYIAQNGRITRIRARDKPSVTVYKPAVRFIRHIQAVNNKNIIITEAADPGRIFEYDPESNDLKTVAENLRQPSYITTADIDEGKRYIITIEDSHSIHVYNTQWKLESIIGKGKSEDEKLCYPHATAVTPKGTLLVANTHKSRISEFSMKGEFLGHVVTSEHGLKAPFGVAFRIPHIWITQSSAAPDDVAIKCYQVVN